jgi:hypothetical protein
LKNPIFQFILYNPKFYKLYIIYTDYNEVFLKWCIDIGSTLSGILEAVIVKRICFFNNVCVCPILGTGMARAVAGEGGGPLDLRNGIYKCNFLLINVNLLSDFPKGHVGSV